MPQLGAELARSARKKPVSARRGAGIIAVGTREGKLQPNGRRCDAYDPHREEGRCLK